MKTSRVRPIVAWILAVILGLLFLLAGVGKLTGGEAVVEWFARWGYAAWFVTVIGVLETAGGLGLFVPRLTRWAILGLTVIMLGAIYTHVAHGETVRVLQPIAFMAGLWGIWWLRGHALPGRGASPAGDAGTGTVA